MSLSEPIYILRYETSQFICNFNTLNTMYHKTLAVMDPKFYRRSDRYITNRHLMLLEVFAKLIFRFFGSRILGIQDLLIAKLLVFLLCSSPSRFIYVKCHLEQDSTCSVPAAKLPFVQSFISERSLNIFASTCNTSASSEAVLGRYCSRTQDATLQALFPRIPRHVG